MLAHTGGVGRFRSEAAFASFCGVAPIEVSSGEVQRHRLSRAGDRQLNYALHVMAITHIQRDSPGKTYYQRKRAAGNSHKEARAVSTQTLQHRLTHHDPQLGFPLCHHDLTQRGADLGTVPDGTKPGCRTYVE
ncbi:transposase [Actinokineospora sp. HUAS TT18]|uniref:transposase n=1 Tax=Actinokineospora sp. HUAS TT18 TaxID=3447451 RepID=UPI003F522FE9